MVVMGRLNRFGRRHEDHRIPRGSGSEAGQCPSNYAEAAQWLRRRLAEVLRRVFTPSKPALRYHAGFTIIQTPASAG